MDNNTTGLFLLIGRLHSSSRPLGRATIVPFAELKLPGVAASYDELIQEFLGAEWIDGDADHFILTSSGMAMLQEASSEHSLNAWFYNQYYQTVLHSRAHSIFCERAYGLDLCQHGMADMTQIRLMLDQLGLSEGMHLLDFGCGDGRISEFISDQTKANVTGVDIACEAIQLAQARTNTKQDRLRYFYADIEKGRGSFPNENFDCICAIDSLFFAQDQRLVLQMLLDHLPPGGKLAAFYIYPPGTTPDAAPFAALLKQLERKYSVVDLTRENFEHWTMKKQVLLELEPLFMEEGSQFLFKNRLAECSGLEQFHRFLYLVEA